MYYPYFRGRQYELLALRELLENNRLSNSIIPVVEPVKLTSTLLKTLESFVASERKIIFIINSEIGTFNSDLKDATKTSDIDRFNEIIKNKNVEKAFILDDNSKNNIGTWNEEYEMEFKDWIVINNRREYLKYFKDIFVSDCPKLTFIPDESSFRRNVRKNRVLIEDRFIKMERNADYSEKIDELFSEDHLYYKGDGFDAFSDYSIAGSSYSESGFAPYAVAIHIVFFDDEKNLRINHFVSDSNNDTQNPANKFYEALKKLIQWYEKEKGNVAETKGLDGFLNHYQNQTYPGLGSIKKLSIMHHIELLGEFLDEDH